MSQVQEQRRHLASRLEGQVRRVVGPRLVARGWRPRVVPFTGYGRPDQVRLLGRVLLTPPGRVASVSGRRGWRHFVSAPSPRVKVSIEIGDVRHETRSDRDGYIDELVPGRFEPGWLTARWTVKDRDPVEAAVLVVEPGAKLGVVSDIDDTVIVTMLPRPLVAFRNAFVLHEDDRRPVNGMARLYRELARAYPDLPFVYLSTGAWNVAPVLSRFLHRHGYPHGPLLLTDWGPTEQTIFRSGAEHKRTQLHKLFEELPEVRWLLIGDDGQADPFIYTEAASERPENVAGIVIRRLSLGEQMATRGTPLPAEEPDGPDFDIVAGGDGDELAEGLRARGLLSPR